MSDYEKCGECNGTGFVTCDKCKGDGTVYRYDTKKKYEERIECGVCEGGRLLSCPKCKPPIEVPWR